MNRGGAGCGNLGGKGCQNQIHPQPVSGGFSLCRIGCQLAPSRISLHRNHFTTLAGRSELPVGMAIALISHLLRADLYT